MHSTKFVRCAEHTSCGPVTCDRFFVDTQVVGNPHRPPYHPAPMAASEYLESSQAVLLDLDGTIYHEEHALPGAMNCCGDCSAKVGRSRA